MVGSLRKRKRARKALLPISVQLMANFMGFPLLKRQRSFDSQKMFALLCGPGARLPVRRAAVHSSCYIFFIVQNNRTHSNPVAPFTLFYTEGILQMLNNTYTNYM